MAFAPFDPTLSADALEKQLLDSVNDERLGPRFPDMSVAFSAGLRAVAPAVELDRGITPPPGV